jgi:predicted ATPase
MKLCRVHIQNFKRISDLEVSLLESDEDIPCFRHVFTGDNGSGKTTVLQAIALVLSLATRRTNRIEWFNWHGFLPERIGTRGPTRIELEVELDPDEIKATREAFEVWHHVHELPHMVPPGSASRVLLVYENGQVSSPDGPEARFQLLGRYYVRKSVTALPAVRELFSRIGDVFWFDQYRNLGLGLTPYAQDTESSDRQRRQTWSVGVGELREFLGRWWAFHLSSSKGHGRDYVESIATAFARVFPGTTVIGPVPSDTTGASVPEFYFLLERDGLRFDISEMSSGEQSLFPLVCDAVQLNIRKSVVLIDELELHLHPPEQQSLLAHLPGICPDSQFLLTSHSEHVVDGFPAERLTRLEGGRPCL